MQPRLSRDTRNYDERRRLPLGSLQLKAQRLLSAPKYTIEMVSTLSRSVIRELE